MGEKRWRGGDTVSGGEGAANDVERAAWGEGGSRPGGVRALNPDDERGGRAHLGEEHRGGGGVLIFGEVIERVLELLDDVHGLIVAVRGARRHAGEPLEQRTQRILHRERKMWAPLLAAVMRLPRPGHHQGIALETLRAGCSSIAETANVALT